MDFIFYSLDKLNKLTLANCEKVARRPNVTNQPNVTNVTLTFRIIGFLV